MKKLLLMAAVLTVLTVILATTAAAQGPQGHSQGGFETCVQDYLDAEQGEQFQSIIAEFKELMSELREKMHRLREEGNFEAFREVQEQRYDLMKERNESLSELVPAEFRDRFENPLKGRRHGGWDKGSGGFNSHRAN